MPRPDFDRLGELSTDFAAHTGFKLVGRAGHPIITDDPLDATFFYKILNPNIFLERTYLKYDKHLFIDVSPVDGLPENDGELKKIYRKAKLWRKVLMQGIGNINSSQKWKIPIKLVTTTIGRLHFINRYALRRLNSLARAVPYEETDCSSQRNAKRRPQFHTSFWNPLAYHP